MKRILKPIVVMIFCISSVGLIFCSNSTVNASTNNVSQYKLALRKGFDKYDKDDATFYKVKQNGNNLYVKISLPDREEIYGGDFYNFHAYQAVKRTKFNSSLTTVTVKNDDDKYTFNIPDIKALSFSHADIKKDAQQYNDGDDNDNEYSYYLKDQLYPKAISHKSYNDDGD